MLTKALGLAFIAGAMVSPVSASDTEADGFKQIEDSQGKPHYCGNADNHSQLVTTGGVTITAQCKYINVPNTTLQTRNGAFYEQCDEVTAVKFSASSEIDFIVSGCTTSDYKKSGVTTLNLQFDDYRTPYETPNYSQPRTLIFEGINAAATQKKLEDFMQTF